MDCARCKGSSASGADGLAVRHVAKRAPAGAEIAQNHECGGTFAETLADVGTGRLFAYGMEFLFTQDSLDFIKLLAVR